jgi:hypothetical protein
VNQNYNRNSNGVGNLLAAIGRLTYIFGFLGGFVGFFADPAGGFVIWISAFISGTMFIGFGEVVKLLQDMVDLQTAQLKNQRDPSAVTKINFDDLPKL